MDVAAVTPSAQGRIRNAQVENSKPDLRRFALLALPLALLLVVFKAYSVEEAPFFSLACLAFGGFAVSYWLPFRFKETFFILLSAGGAYLLLSPVVASLLFAVGLAMFAIVRSTLAFRSKALVLLAIFGACAVGRATGRFSIPKEFWPVFGSIFMFRGIIYLYDLRHQRGPASLKEYFAYFFLLPNYYFLLFPTVDFQTFKKSYFQRNIHTIAQTGVWWIFRGTTHLLLYRLVYQLQSAFSPPKVPVAEAVAAKILLNYLLYLRVSGQFHIVTGMLRLFGYDLPETNHLYLLANSINDYWRRINIYFKDFMVKVFYFPAYFKLRKKGELRAKLLATMLVFVVTWFFHAYQFFWLQGEFRITLNDTLFWTAIGVLMMANVWIAHKYPKPLPMTGWPSKLRNALQIAATLAVISVLWSLWNAGSVTEWVYFLRTGNV